MTDRHPRDADGTLDALLTVVVVSAVVVRFWNLAYQPWLDLEDVQHVGYAKDLADKGLLGHGATYVMWTVIGALTWKVAPVGPYAEMFLSAAFGSMSIVLIYMLASAWHSRLTGVFAAAVLAASLNHLHFSRWAQPQAAAIFFVLLAFVLDDRAQRGGGSPSRIVTAGCVAGVGLLCHLTLFPLPATLVIVAALGAGPAAQRMKRALLMAAGIAAPLLTAEVIVRVLRLVTGRANIGSPIGHLWLVPNYAAYEGGALESIQRPDPLLFWRYLWEAEGGLFVVAALAGWIAITSAMARGRTEANRLRQGYGESRRSALRAKAEASAHESASAQMNVALWVVLTGAYVGSILATLSTGTRLFRYIAPLVPATVLGVAAMLSFAVVALQRRLSARGAARVVAALCAVVLASGYVRAHRRLALDTGFETVWSIVRQHGARRVAFIGSPGTGNMVDISRWELLTTYMPAETVTLPRLEDADDLRPPPQLVLVGMDPDGQEPTVRGFHSIAAVPLRMPSFDARPADHWTHTFKVFILRE